jgi:carboxylesterase type B
MYTLIFKFFSLSTFASLTSGTSEPLVVSRRSSVPTVHTNGVVFHGNLSDGVESFFNLKFGQSTGGENRFSHPKPFHYPQDTIFDASIPGVACPQQRVPITGLSVFSNVTAYSEDCLTLRVDRPANTLSDAKLPVMVYIYGGGFSSGQIYDRAYNPTGLVVSAAKKGIPVIYVAIK